MYNETRVLVTGGTGLVGNAVKELSKSYFPSFQFVLVSSTDADLTDWEQTRTLFDRIRPQAVIHLAARVGGLFENMRDNLGFLQDNLRINQNVVNACHEHRIENAVFCLSTCIFSVSTELPLTEDQIHTGAPHQSNEGYSHSKRILECLVRLHAEKYGYNWCCAIPTNLYGPHDNFDLGKGHVIPALVRRFIESKLTNSDLTLRGTGTAMRQFLFAKDFARILIFLLSKNACGNFICCSPEPDVSISQLVTLTSSRVGFGGKIVFDGDISCDGVKRKTASADKLFSYLGDGLSFTGLKEGLAETISWYEEQSQAANLN